MKVLFLLHGVAFCCISAMGRARVSSAAGALPSPQPPYRVRGRLSPTTGEGVRGFTTEGAGDAEGSQVKVLFLLHGVAFCCISAVVHAPSLCISPGGLTGVGNVWTSYEYDSPDPLSLKGEGWGEGDVSTSNVIRMDSSTESISSRT